MTKLSQKIPRWPAPLMFYFENRKPETPQSTLLNLLPFSFSALEQKQHVKRTRGEYAKDASLLHSIWVAVRKENVFSLTVFGLHIFASLHKLSGTAAERKKWPVASKEGGQGGVLGKRTQVWHICRRRFFPRYFQHILCFIGEMSLVHAAWHPDCVHVSCL